MITTVRIKDLNVGDEFEMVRGKYRVMEKTHYYVHVRRLNNDYKSCGRREKLGVNSKKKVEIISYGKASDNNS